MHCRSDRQRPRSFLVPWLIGAAALLCAWRTDLAAQTPSTARSLPGEQEFVQNGISIRFSAMPLDHDSKVPREQGDISLRFRLSDTSGAALTSARPAAWIDTLETRDAGTTCASRVKGFLEGSLFYRPAADLNSYYVLTLNNDASISVVDPLVGYGGTHLLTTVALASPGVDWLGDPRHDRIFVSMPDAKRIAVVDTSTWKVKRELPMRGRPGRLLLQPDQQYLWAAWEPENPDEDSGVVVFDAQTFEVAARIVTGQGRHDIAFSGDNRYAAVTNESSGDVAIIDVHNLPAMLRIASGRRPRSIAY